MIDLAVKFFTNTSFFCYQRYLTNIYLVHVVVNFS
jgi:hypothetical protein